MGTYGYTGSVEDITITSTGEYDITAFGGQGGSAGSASGGDGAEIGGTILLHAGEVLRIIVGGQGSSGNIPYRAYSPGGYGAAGAGGGGGSFVLYGNGRGGYDRLVIAGGGGGAGGAASGGDNGYSGSTSRTAGSGGYMGGAGGMGGGGGYSGGYAGGGGGGGFYGSGGSGGLGGSGYLRYGSNGTTGAQSYAGGSGGLYKYQGGSYNNGAFGGGGGGGFNRVPASGHYRYYGGGGGGGGYNGGGGGGIDGGGGGGGGSFFAGYAQVHATTHTGAGEVTITEETICYLRGTRILTPAGEVAVEDLRGGDLVITRFGGVRPVRWVGRQAFAAAFLQRDRARLPVRIRAGALADGVPVRDLYVSPGHSMLVGGVLVLAEALVNGVTVTQDWCPAAVHYYQLDLGPHDCVLAEGAWSESYADGPGLRDRFHNLAEFEAAFPDEVAPERLALCAPRPERGAGLDEAIRPLIARAGRHAPAGPLRGYIDPVIDGRTVPGWAFDAAHPALPVLLEVLLGETLLGCVLACDFRADLRDAGFGGGRCSFAFTSPVVLTAAMLPALRVRRAADGAAIGFTDEGRAAFCAPMQAAA